MKKVITILAILVVLVGSVFAEDHKIKIKADVAERTPAFSLSLDSITTNGTNKTDFGTNPTYYNETGVDVGFDLDENGSVTVTAYVVNSAQNHTKTNKSYTLEFSDGIFTVNRNGVEGTHAPASITTSALTTTTGIKTIVLGDVYMPNPDFDDTQAESEENPATIVNSTATNKPVVITFSGATMTADKDVATAVYAYTADSTIDPTASGNYYYADIIMTVTANT